MRATHARTHGGTAAKGTQAKKKKKGKKEKRKINVVGSPSEVALQTKYSPSTHQVVKWKGGGGVVEVHPYVSLVKVGRNISRRDLDRRAVHLHPLVTTDNGHHYLLCSTPSR